MRSKLRIFFMFSILVLIVASAYLSYTYTPVALGWSDVAEYPDETTYISAQGFHFEGQADATKPGRLIAATPQGNTIRVCDGYEDSSNWFYNVEPVNKTHLSVTLSQKNHTEGVLFSDLLPLYQLLTSF